jgi:preprotein translocase subunit SecA
MDRTGAEEGEVITHPWVTAAIGQAQKRVELQNFQARKRLLQFDDVMNQQREVIYSQRLYALEGGEELKAEAQRMIEGAVERLVDGLTAQYDDPGRWDRALIETEFLQKFLISVPGVTDPAKIKTRAELVHAAQQAGREAFQEKVRYLKDVESKIGAVKLSEQALSHVTLGVIDEKWKDHLYDLDQLREGIYYRAWGQKDPLVEYKQEAFEMFVGLMHDLQATFAERWFKLQIQIDPPPGQGGQRPPSRGVTGPAGGLPGARRRETPMVASKPAADGLVTAAEPPPPSLQRAGRGGGVAEPAFATNPYAGVGRNDPCPCGSGKKFKKCHGAAA